MFEVLKGFKDMAEFIKALKEYFELKNKVLWESSTSWSTGTKTITDISKYQTIQVWLYLGNSSMLMTRRGNLFIGGTSIGYPAWHATFYAELSLNGENVTIDGQYLSHNQSSNHGAITKAGIGKIIGITPMIPETLKKYLGGVLKVPIFLLGGGYHAVSKKVFKGCFEFRKISASNICWNELRTNRKAANAMGTFRDNIDRSRHKHGQKLWYKNSSICKTVFCCAQSVIRTRKFIKLFNVGWGTKRHGYKHGCINNSYPRSFNFNGVRLACDRRGKITDWRCCHV